MAGHAAARVGDFEHGFTVDPSADDQGDLTFLGELDPIVQQVSDDLDESLPVDHHPVGGRQVDRHVPAKSVLGTLTSEHGLDLGQSEGGDGAAGAHAGGA